MTGRVGRGAAGNRLKLGARLRFTLERLVLRGLHYRLLVAVGIVILVAVLGGVVVVALDPDVSSWWEGIWWAFLRLTDPGYLGDDEGAVRRTVSTIVTVLGYLLFLGLLIAILTQWLDNTIEELESGVTPVILEDHVLILGWTHRTPTIATGLLGSRHRLTRFLERQGARRLRIVILAEHVDGDLLRELRERLGVAWDDRQVLLRAGSPLRVDDLERIAFLDAAALILPGAGFAERNPEHADAETVKTLMSMARDARAAGVEPPLAVVELFDSRRAAVARKAYSADCEIVVADEIVSRIIAQSARQPGLADLFVELSTLNVGNAIYVRRLDGQAGARFGDYQRAFDRAILVGTVRTGEPRPTLAPDPDTVIGADDLLVFVARSYVDCEPGTVSPSKIPDASSLPGPRAPPVRRILILGWSRKVPVLLREFERYGDEAFELDVVSATPVAEREATFKRHAREPSGERVRHIEVGYTVPGALARLEPQAYDNVILMASERLSEEETADAVTVLAYLSLRGMLPEEGPRPAVFVELLEEENRALFADEDADVLVSPMLVSYLLSQVALRRELAALFAELTRPRGAQVLLRSAQDYLGSDRPLCFADLELAAAAHGELALGFRRAEGPQAGLVVNPERSLQWTPAPGDDVLVLTSRSGASEQAPA